MSHIPPILQILGAWLYASVLFGMLVGPFIRAGHTPSPCERDAQDGRGEAGEGAEFRTIHNEGISS